MNNRKSVSLLPEYLQTDKNKKFLSGTLDPLIQKPQLERLDGFVGSVVTPNFNPKTDSYIKEDLPLRTEYSLEPALVFKDSVSAITDVIAFDDIINEIKIQGGKTDNLDTLFAGHYHSFDPYIDYDKLVNYDQYYWLSAGPDAIKISSINVDTSITNTSTYTMSNGYALSNGMKIAFDKTVTPSKYRNNEYYVEGVGNIIKLINTKLLEVNEKVSGIYNETFDSDKFDNYPFDSDRRLPIVPEYITINRSSNDLNPWTRYNRWFHAEIIRITSEINNQGSVIYPLDARAQRPIVEFKPNIQLYNFGTNGIENVDLIDDSITDAMSVVHGSVGYYIDGIMLEHGYRVIFNATSSTIYTVNFDTSTQPPTLNLIANTATSVSNSVEVNYGVKNAGTSWHYGSTANGNNTTFLWLKSQQRTTINQAPLFELYDPDGVSYSNRPPGSSNFIGCKIFGYDVGVGSNDKVLGFPLKYKNSVGVGSYLFKNYFMADTITVNDNISSVVISTSIGYFKVQNELKNVWSEIQNYKTPIIEIQQFSEFTNTTVLSSISLTATSVISYVNGNLVKSKLDSDGMTIQFESNLNVDDVVSFEIITDSIPNSNGYYKTPLSLTNNPLNGPITSMTLSEISDHLFTMISHIPKFKGKFPGLSNLRDLNNYSKYGKRLVINSNPISFAQIFLGKKEHNVIDSIRYAADNYNQFKMNLLRVIANVDNTLTPADALDVVLKEINSNKSSIDSYYSSDMLGYGSDKKTLNVSATSSGTNYIVYVNSLLESKFDLTTPSFRSIIVYVNDEQLNNGTDYIFHTDDETIEIIKSVSIGDAITVNYYTDTHGSFIPSTPSKLGLYPKYEPEIYRDTSYLGPEFVDLIRGHDGSFIRTYGDYRDNIILEYEKRVFNNIKATYNTDIIDLISLMPGAFRNTSYSLNTVNEILTKDFIKWTSTYNIDANTNNLYDEASPLTWNYVGSTDVLFGKSVPGFWRGIFNYFYDTDRPHTHPWEMLGHSLKPSWWDTYYSWTDLNKRPALITAITYGYTEEPPSIHINPNYARPGFINIIPVDSIGGLKDLAEWTLVTNNSYLDKKSNWKFGDQGPAETAWRRSSYWPFVSNIVLSLLNPCLYTSSMYDTSRTKLNRAKQIVYNNEYLNPKNLLIEGNVQTYGYGVYVVERGKQQNLNYINSLKQDLTYLDFNLFHKLGGFASKDKLQIIIDSIDPVSQAQGAILPPEDYSLILNVSNPIKSASISGVIIQRLESNFIIKGYDKTNPYFEIFKPIIKSSSGAITIGGISSPFTEWQGSAGNGNSLGAIEITSPSSTTSHYYKAGQILRYNGSYYIVKVSHETQPTFDVRLFQKLADLPMTGGTTVETYTKFENVVTRIPYGTSFSKIQDVYDVLVGYGVYLEKQGFIFDEFNSNLGNIVDWKFTGKEFLYWTTQNWADGNLITLSPFAEYLKYSYIDSIVDNVSTGKYEYSLLKADGKSFPIDKFQLSREDNVCVIKTIDTLEGIFFATLNSVQKEHAMVFNNTTVFNDTIYDIETGYKQRRIKLSGFRTSNWNGDLSSPGFVYDNVSITDWISYSTYLPGNIVRYNGSYYESNEKIINDSTFDFNKWTKLNEKPKSNLLPNFDYKINQFEDFYSLDIDNFDATQQALAQHLIGYTPRPYFNNIFTNPITQYKFYQGFIREKGTKNAVDKLAKVGKFTRQGDITFNEDWAFRIGDYGSFSTYKEIEFTLDENTTLENPYVVKFVDNIPTNFNPLIDYILTSKLLITPDDYEASSTFITSYSTFFDNNLTLVNAGYARIDDVTATAYNRNSLLDIANNSVIQEGDTIWMGFLENGDWGISRYLKQISKIIGVYVSAPAIDITFTVDKNHNLSIGDIISVVQFNAQVNGVYVVKNIPQLNQITVASELTTIVNADLVSPGKLFKFENARFSNIEEVSKLKNLLKFNEGYKLWIDNGADNKWQVFNKITNYPSENVNYYDSILRNINQHLGHAIYTTDDIDILLASAPGDAPTNKSIGSISVYKKNLYTNQLLKQFTFTLNDSYKLYCQSAPTTEFGYSLIYENNKALCIAGAPGASGVIVSAANTTTTGIVILSTGSGYRKPFIAEGIVKITSILNNQDQTEAVLVNPYSISSGTASHARFGHSIYINQNTATNILLVGAPGYHNSDVTGRVYAYNLTKPTSTSTVSITAHSSGIELPSHVSLTAGSRFGHKIVGDLLGNVIAISAPSHYGSIDKIGVVQLFNKNLTWFQTLTSPFGTSQEFGDDVVISEDGLFIFVSSTYAKKNYEPYGKVAVYKKALSGNTYNVFQIIDNPLDERDLKFGYSISINSDNSILAISSLGTNNTEISSFTDDITFDGNKTQFINPIPDSGTVYVFNKVNDYFILLEELTDSSILTGSKFGLSVKATTDSIFVGAPFTNPTELDIKLTSEAQVGTLSLAVTPSIVTWQIDSSSNVIYTDPTPRVANAPLYGEVENQFPVSPGKDNSRIYQFAGTGNGGWKVLRQEPDIVDITTIDRITFIDSFKEEVIEYLDVIDPLKGKIAGIAEQELKYKSVFDPATYSLGIPTTIIDSNSSWIDDHVGELWWDLSTVKYVWYEQGDDIFRKNNWGRVFPGSSIDVYEWIRSDLLPSEWAAKADTNSGLTKGISGQPKYPDNTVVSVKQIFNNVTNGFENVYFYWVKNKVLVPSNVANRRISSYQVSSIIQNPISSGLKFAEILSPSSIAFANIQSMLVGNRINANIAMDSIGNKIPRHTEWLLLSEGDKKGIPPQSLEKKLFDSLLGHDSDGNAVPAINLTYRSSYGTSIRPQQSMFKNRIQALRTLIEFANSVLIKNIITGNYSFDKLNKKEPIPDIDLREYDIAIDNLEDLANIKTEKLAQATLDCYVSNGKIVSVDIISPGFGYTIPPTVRINSTIASSVEISTEIDINGSVISTTIKNAGSGFDTAPQLIVRPYTVIIKSNEDYNYRWTKHEYNSSSLSWRRIKNQTYNTSIFWKYVDWVSSDYVNYKEYSYLINGVYELETLYNVNPGEYVKVNNGIERNYIILERLTDKQIGNFSKNYNIVFVENGTIQILDSIWEYSKLNYAYDIATLDEVLYDQIPDAEILYILKALKEDIFIHDLTVNWNLFFFVAVKYALTEQKLLDWAFKTSFINVTNSIGNLDQRSVYKLDNEKYFEEYINEVKPYHSKIRNYTSNYSYLEDTGELFDFNLTDFDLPSYYNTVTNKFEIVSSSSTFASYQAWKTWSDNYTSEIGEIIVSNNGTLYTEQPTVNIIGGGPSVTTTATAEAYIRNGGIYKIAITNPGAGYTKTPLVTISGGGVYVVTNATASAKLSNSKIRKNLIGIKFDRVGSKSEIGITRVSDTFVCLGDTDKFILTWLAEPDKSNIIPTLDKKLILSADYTIEYYTEQYNGYNKKYSRFVFLNYVPLPGQIFKIIYDKNINLYTSVDRIKNLYTSTAILSSLMDGIVYPGNIIQGLPFDYSVPWDTVTGSGEYEVENSTWSELVNYYTTAKIVSTATINSTVLYLNTTTGIVPGLIINVLNSSTSRVREDTIVTSVNSATRSITISQPSFRIIRSSSTSTVKGTEITITTVPPFNGGILVGDNIVISEISPSEYNGHYKVKSILDDNHFVITATSILSTTSSILSELSLVTVLTILTTIHGNSVLLGRINERYTSTGTIFINSSIKYQDISNIDIFLDNSITKLKTGDPLGSHISSEYYQVTKDINENALITLYQMTNTNVGYNIDILMYGNPTIEFWRPELEPTGIEKFITGGGISNGNFIGALGTGTSEVMIDGDIFLSKLSGYAPEELVAGHSLDSLGVNVYTKDDNSYATVVSGVFPVVAGEISSATISVPPLTSNIMVHYNGISFDRLSAYNRNEGPYFVPIIAQPSGDVGIQITNTGGDDNFSGPYSLGMVWNMYGVNYTEVYVGTNGYLTFGAGSAFWTPLDIRAFNIPGIFVEYTDLWQDFGINGQPLITGETPGLFISQGTYGLFAYWKLRFQGSHYSQRDNPTVLPAYDYEVTLYSNGIDQYVEMIYQRTWKGTNVNGDIGFVCGISDRYGASQVSIPYTNINDNTSHVFYSSSGGGQWSYAGLGKFNPFRNPFVFTTSNQYYTIGNTIFLAPQLTSGRAAYSVIDVGSDRSLIDKAMITVQNTTTAIVESVASIDDVRKACVYVDGIEAKEFPDLSGDGYVLTQVSDTNKRACVKMTNLSSIPHTIEVWFFQSKYTNFNRIHEDIFLIGSTATSIILLNTIPGNTQPVSDKVIVETSKINLPGTRKRLIPPRASYYKIANNQTVFDVDDSMVHPQYTYNADTVKVYANGVILNPGFDYTLDEIFSRITLESGLLKNGDVLAVVGLYDNEFVISGNILKLNTALTNSIVKITSFTEHDNMLMRTERFFGNPTNKFKLKFPFLNENYLWVYLNGRPLIADYDFVAAEDSRTVELNQNIRLASTSTILITTVNPPSYGTRVVGYRIFNDMFNRHHFNRMSAFYSTTLENPLNYFDKEIVVTDASRLIPPNPLKNKPGVVLIDGERIEFMIKDGNILRQLRRGTLGTSPALISIAGTTVIDQSIQQSIPYRELTSVQTTSTTSLIYNISTLTNSIIGSGIKLDSAINAIDQVDVFYGGRELRKIPLSIHNNSKAYDTTSTSMTVLPPEFIITTATQQLILNFTDTPEYNTDIAIVQRKGYVWTGSESLLTSNSIQSIFLREKEAALPDVYYYGGFNVNIKIVAGDIQRSTQYNSPTYLVIDPILLEGGPIDIVGIGPILPKHGNCIISGKQILYRPFSTWAGADIFDYFIIDKAGNKGFAKIIIVTAKLVLGPINIDIAYNSTDNPIDPIVLTGGPLVELGKYTNPAHGSVTTGTTITGEFQLYYTPTQFYYGNDSFQYYGKDIANNYSGNIIRIRVLPPTGLVAGNDVMIAITSSTNNRFNPVLLAGGPVTGAGISSQPSHGTLSVKTGTFILLYTPTPGYVGLDSFNYYIEDLEYFISTATVNVKVGTLLLDSHTSTVYINSTDNEIKTKFIIESIDNFGEPFYVPLPENYPFDFYINTASMILSVTSPTPHGTASVVDFTRVLYSPGTDWVGTDTFKHSLIDPWNVYSEADMIIKTEKIVAGSIDVSVLFNSVDNQIKSIVSKYGPIQAIRIDTPPSHGTLNILPGLKFFTYTPDTGWTGYDTFTYSVQDTNGNWSNPATGRIYTLPF